MDDLDVPGGWTHWLVFNLQTSVTKLPESQPRTNQLPDGGLQGSNSWNRIGYGGPCPPRGTHTYQITLYAVDTSLSLSAGARISEFRASLEGHILAESVITGTVGQ